MSASKVASIRALQELKGIVCERKKAKHQPLLSQAEIDMNEMKKNISRQIQKEIEELAVKTYEKYGLKVIPLCHRSNSYQDNDVVRAELRVTLFDETLQNRLAYLRNQEAIANQKIEDWYFKAVQAVAEQNDLPATPEF